MKTLALRFGLALLALAALAACASSPIHEFGSREEVPPGHAVVCGRVRAKLWGHEAEWGSGGASFTFTFKEKQTLATMEREVPDDGVFAWTVPAGTYGVYSTCTYWARGATLAPGLALELFTLAYESYTVTAVDRSAGQRWSWGPTQCPPELDGTVFLVNLEAGKTYFLGDRSYVIDGEAFKSGPRDLTFNVTRSSFWRTEDECKKALAGKYAALDVAAMRHVENQDGDSAPAAAANAPAPSTPATPTATASPGNAGTAPLPGGWTPATGGPGK